MRRRFARVRPGASTAPVLIATLLAAGLLTACGGGGPAGEGRLQAHGDVRIVRSSGQIAVVTGTANLARGDKVEVTSGSADVTVPAGATFELRASGPLSSVVTFDRGAHLEGGDLLVASARRDVEVTDRAGGVAVRGVARVRRDLALTVATYQGVSSVTSAGRTLPVPAYRQVALPALGLLPDRPAPLALDAGNVWDRRYLGEAIDLTAQLDSTSTGFSNSVATGRAATASFFRGVVAGLVHEATFTDVLLSSTGAPLSAVRAPGEVLVGASIVELSRFGSFDQRWLSVFGFRDQGAAWGLVALDQHIDPDALLRAIAGAVDRASLAFTVPAGPGVGALVGGTPTFVAAPPAPATPATAPPGGSRSTPTTAAPPPGAVTRPTTPVTTPPVTVTTLPPSPLSPVVDPVVQLVNKVAGGLLGTSP